MQLQPKYRSKIYGDFQTIPATEWRTVVRYYESCEEQIRELDFAEYFVILMAYTNALFETGAYQKHLLMADVLIETSVMNDVELFRGEDVFRYALFRKASSYFFLHELDKCEYILRELLRINPYDQPAALLLKKCLRKKHPAFVAQARAAAIFLFLLSAFIICLEVLIVRPFYPAFDQPVEMSRNFVFLLGILALVSGDLIHWRRSIREVDAYVEGLKERKNAI